MKANHDHHFTQSVDTIYGTFTEPTFIKAKLEALGSRDIEVAISAAADGATRIVITRQVPVDAPGALQAVVGDWMTIRQTELWRGEQGGPYHAELTIEPVGMPAEMRAETALLADGTGCLCEALFEAKCAIPLMGGKVEKFMIRDAGATIEREFAYIAANA